MRRLTAVSAVENIAPWQAGVKETARESTELLVQSEEQWNGMLPKVGSKLKLDVVPSSLGVVDDQGVKVAGQVGDILACFVLEAQRNKFLSHIGTMVHGRRVSMAVIFSIMEIPPDDPLIQNLNVGLQEEPDYSASGLLVIPAKKNPRAISPVAVHRISDVWGKERHSETLGIGMDLFDRARQIKERLAARN